MLKEYGPGLSRPYADTLKNSEFANMTELRLTVDNGEWQVAFAFDAKSRAILLCAGDKSGMSRQFAAHQTAAISAEGGK